MADKKISELGSITGSQINDTTDVFVIVDTSTNSNKKVTREEVFKEVTSIKTTGSATFGTNTLFVDTVSGFVGVNNLSPSAPLDVLGSPGVLAEFRDSVAANFLIKTSGNKTTIGNAAGSSQMGFMVGNTEVATLDTQGYFGVGTNDPATAIHISGTGVADSRLTVERSGTSGIVGVLSNDMVISSLGSTGSNGGISFYTGGGSNMHLAPDGTLRPDNDGTQNLGNASFRWDVVYASTGTINTSDFNAKTDIEKISEAERRVANKAKGLLRKYRYKAAVSEKDNSARYHFGVIAQDLAEAFYEEALDPFAYGVLCFDEWWEIEVEVVVDVKDGEEVKVMELQRFKTLDESPEGAVYKSRYGVRYDELFALMLSTL